jgi:nicotinamidase-related amidase
LRIEAVAAIRSRFAFQKEISLLTTLDPNTALIIIDLQKGIVGLPVIHPITAVIGRAQALADAFRGHGLPVALVNVDGGAPGRTEQTRSMASYPEGWTDLIPELNQQPGDIMVTKRTWGAFASTDLEAQLKARGVTQVVVAGVATATGVESTARQAYELGFNVTLALDAMTDLRPEAHEYSIQKVFPRLGESGSSQEIIGILQARSA